QNFAFIGKGTVNVRRKADHLGVQTGETEVIRKGDLQEHQQFQSRVDPDFPQLRPIDPGPGVRHQ
ncbi:MAG: hypothetical protein AAFO91_19940, partial [Bacteroidota bacterium]